MSSCPVLSWSSLLAHSWSSRPVVTWTRASRQLRPTYRTRTLSYRQPRPTYRTHTLSYRQPRPTYRTHTVSYRQPYARSCSPVVDWSSCPAVILSNVVLLSFCLARSCAHVAKKGSGCCEHNILTPLWSKCSRRCPAVLRSFSKSRRAGGNAMRAAPAKAGRSVDAQDPSRPMSLAL
jgi:hypothetical protein